ncbi:uncharacterized protein LOC131652952 [Vicia villosa]|uniref:uncharacterized protein LOC131652952 n=1 Tax=Vicia villosa TaxID=3911 RepID=UPI00273A9238|nr:uncharacterized protein LOC131652952 [Vicia villosa]
MFRHKNTDKRIVIRFFTTCPLSSGFSNNGNGSSVGKALLHQVELSSYCVHVFDSNVKTYEYVLSEKDTKDVLPGKDTKEQSIRIARMVTRKMKKLMTRLMIHSHLEDPIRFSHQYSRYQLPIKHIKFVVIFFDVVS